MIRLQTRSRHWLMVDMVNGRQFEWVLCLRVRGWLLLTEYVYETR